MKLIKVYYSKLTLVFSVYHTGYSVVKIVKYTAYNINFIQCECNEVLPATAHTTQQMKFEMGQQLSCIALYEGYLQQI